MTCLHRQGGHVRALGGWVCGQCWCRLDQRPTRYGRPKTWPLSQNTDGPNPPQVITWQAEAKLTTDGTDIATFLGWIALVFQRHCPGLTRFDAVLAALHEMEMVDEPFAATDFDWTRDGAEELAKEFMQNWDADEGEASNA